MSRRLHFLSLILLLLIPLLFTEQLYLPSLANGYIGTALQTPRLQVKGLYNTQFDAKQFPAHGAVIPVFNQLESDTFTHEASLRMDFKEAIGNVMWEASDGTKMHVESFAHRQYYHLFVQRIEIDNPKGKEVCLGLSAGEPTKDVDFKLIGVGPKAFGWNGSIAEPEIPNGEKTRVYASYSTLPNEVRRYVQPSESPLKRRLCWNDTMVRETLFTVVNTGLDRRETHLDEISLISESLQPFQFMPYEELRQRHVNQWKRIWENGIEVFGGEQELSDLNDVVQTSLYYILASINEDWSYSVAPGTIDSPSYNSHVFWDAELFVGPNLLHLWPAMARSMIQYRLDRMPGAREKARSYSPPYEGLMFPWESAGSGIETCPSWAETGELEQHISSDIVFALKQYLLTQDATKEELNSIWELVSGVADFWTSRVSKRPGTSQYDILGVIPPDEYAINVNNSVYTNAAAQIALDFAVRLGKQLQKDVQPVWQTIADSLYFPYDANSKVFLEFEGYKRGQKIKQADVVLLQFPLKWKHLTTEIAHNNLKYYETVTDVDEGPAMTWAMHLISELELGKSPESELMELFLRSYKNNTKNPPFYVWQESPNAGAVNFITGAGGFLQGLVHGFAGLRIVDKGEKEQTGRLDAQLSFNPQVIPRTKGLQLRGISLKGRTFDVTYDAQKVILKNRSNGSLWIDVPELKVVRREVRSGESHVFARHEFIVDSM